MDKTQKEKLEKEWIEFVEASLWQGEDEYTKNMAVGNVSDWWLEQFDLAIKETEERIVREIDSTIETTSICSMHKDWNEDCKICRATTMPRSMLLSLKEKLLSTL